MAKYDGASINQVLRTVKAIAGGDGDVELSLLAHALVVASISTDVDRATVHEQIDKIWDHPGTLIPLPPAN